MSKPRILFLVTQNDRGGAQQYVLTLATAFRDRAEVMVAAGPDGNGWLQKELAAAGISFFLLPSLRREVQLRTDRRAVKELRALLREKNITVLHANSSKAGFIASCALIGVTPAPRHIYTAHGWIFLEPAWQKKFFYFAELFASMTRDVTITLSRYEAAVAHWLGIFPPRIAMIPHGILPPMFLSREDARQALGIPQEQMTLGTIANAYDTKGLDVLLSALAQTDSALHWVCIGDGPLLPSLKKQTKELGIESRVTWLGAKENAAQYLRAFDAFVLPSRKEGLPYALLEALHADLPIIATTVGGIPEMCGDAALLVPPENTHALAQAINTLQNQNTQQGLVTARQLLKPTLTTQYEKMIEQTWDVYHTKT